MVGPSPSGSSVIDSINNLDAGNPLHWDRCNAMVLTWIMNVVSQDVYTGLVYSKNATVVWKELRETYDKVNGSAVYNLLQKINSVKQGGSLIADYYHRLNSLWREFDALTKLPKYICDVKCCCDAIRSSLLTRYPLPEVKDAYNVISKEESHRRVPKSSGGTESKQNATSFVAKTFNNNKKYSLRPKLIVPLSILGTSIIVNRGPNPFFNGNAWFNINFSRYFYSNSSLSMTTITLGWIIDFGANQHLTGSTSGMSNVVDISDLKITVGHPNGTLAVISHVGNLKLANNVMLYDFLVVPRYCDLKREKILGTGSESGGLYLFDVNKSNCIGQSNMVMTFHVSKLLWHNRLGHPADQVLSVLKKDLNIADNTFVPMCEIYQRAKQTREPFPLSDHKSKYLGELVHLDLWGPYRVHSREGYRYFLTIVDDYSMAVWVDVKFYENVFPFKQKTCDLTDVENTSEVDHLQFFDSLKPQSTNDDGRDSSNEEGSLPYSDLHDSTQGRNQSDRLTATQIGDQNWS
ncbi:ribonuclease H-like domain-containing protein [Tanacetum coccineum]